MVFAAAYLAVYCSASKADVPSLYPYVPLLRYYMTDLLLSDADLSRGGNVTVYENCTTSLIRVAAA